MPNNLTPGTAGEIFLYQDSRKSGSVHRFVVTLTMHIHRTQLEKTLDELMPRFPQFAAGIRKEGQKLVFFPLTAKVPVFRSSEDFASDRLPDIGSKELGEYLFRISYSQKTIFFDWHLSLSDGKGMLEFIKSVIFRYIEMSGFPVKNDGTVKEPDEPANAIEGADPYERLDDIPASRPVWYMDAKAFNAPKPDDAVSSGLVYVRQIRVPVSKVKGPVREYLSQPESFISPLYSHVLYGRFSDMIPQGEYIVSTIKENLRPHFPTASLRAYFSPMTLAYNRKVDEYPFGTVLMSRKKLLDAQLKQDALAYSAKRMMKTAAASCDDSLTLRQKIERCGKSLDMAAETATFSICNLGNIAMPESLQQYLVEFYPVVPPGSYANSLSVVNFKGDMVITLTDSEGDMSGARSFVELLNRYDIPAFISDEFRFTQIRYSPEKFAEENG